jgi:hypothetical protein
MEQAIRKYFQACNNADAAEISASFQTDVGHYAPSIPKMVRGNSDRRQLRKKG